MRIGRNITLSPTHGERAPERGFPFIRVNPCLPVVAILLLFVSSCTSTKNAGSVSASARDITELNMLAVPVALNLDGFPGPDTIAVKIYAGNLREASPVPITTGRIELLMFNGLLKRSTNAPVPLHTWTFPARQLKRFEYKASIGTGYELTASWTTNKPTASKVTLISRYLTDSAPPVYSSPSTISITAH